MSRIFITVGVLLLILSAMVTGQTQNANVSVSNSLRYGNGKETIASLTQRKEYVENVTDTRIAVHDFVVGFQLLYDAPPEYGVNFAGIRKRFVVFKRKGLSIRVGDSFALYGRGLALNLFEKRNLYYDTGLDGVKLEYHTKLFTIDALGGNVFYRDVATFATAEEYQIRAAMTEINPVDAVNIGCSFISGQVRFPFTMPIEPRVLSTGPYAARFDMPELHARISAANTDLYASYIEKRTLHYGQGGIHKGNAFYGSLSYSGDWFGLSTEYKDYRLGIMNPIDRLNPRIASRALIIQNLPIVHKEHTFARLAQYNHIMNPNDEVGFQVEAYALIADQHNFTANFSAASRHYDFKPTGDTVNFIPVYSAQMRSRSYIPSLEAKYSPFWEFYAEYQYFFEPGENDYALLAFNRRFEQLSDELDYSFAHGPKISTTETYTVPIEAQYTIADPWSVKIVAETQRVHDDKNMITPWSTYQTLIVGVSHSPDYSVTMRLEMTNDENTLDRRSQWFAVDVGYRLGMNHNFIITVGSESGGCVCTSGICRIVNPFRGVRFSAISYL